MRTRRNGRELDDENRVVSLPSRALGCRGGENPGRICQKRSPGFGALSYDANSKCESKSGVSTIYLLFFLTFYSA